MLKSVKCRYLQRNTFYKHVVHSWVFYKKIREFCFKVCIHWPAGLDFPLLILPDDLWPLTLCCTSSRLVSLSFSWPLRAAWRPPGEEVEGAAEAREDSGKTELKGAGCKMSDQSEWSAEIERYWLLMHIAITLSPGKVFALHCLSVSVVSRFPQLASNRVFTL